MEVSKFKRRLFVYMIVAKVTTLLYIGYRAINYGFNGYSEVIASIAIIMPLFSVYLTVIIRDIIRNGIQNTKQETTVQNQTKVSKSLRILTNVLFPIYLILIILVIEFKTSLAINFETFQALVGSIETGFGVYIAQVIFTVFGKPNIENPQDNES